MPIAPGEDILASDVSLNVQVNNSPGAVQSGFTLVGVVQRTLLNNKLVYIRLEITTNAALTPTGTNLTTDPSVFVFNANLPSEPTNGTWSNGAVDGEAQLGTDGNCILRTASGTVTAGSGIRLAFSYIRN